ncbi:peptide chain release factor N(5)-glutamine methyltransferase [Peptococcus simiae]|uniref:peptide chain release factor N(5)-glutamine methyltransferase n=1 Tax=Peptococcus simiae TaxID=1643805 RepID=UPI00397F04C0
MTSPKTWQGLFNEALAQVGRDRRLAVERLMVHARDMDRALALAHLDEPALAAEEEVFTRGIRQLLDHRPLQYILGEAPFADFSLQVGEGVLIPRFDTEILVDQVLALVAEGPFRLLDLCTGSGVVAIALARRCPAWEVFASDISPEALDQARANARRLAVAITFAEGDLFAPWQGQTFDLITANPPYISSADMETLPAEVRQEPHLALWGGADGLDFYRRLAQEGLTYLRPGGYMACEIGAGQGEAVVHLFRQAGFQDLVIHYDWQGHDRVVLGRKER